MTILDLVLVVVWAGITLGGFFKGAIRIVFGLGGLALGIWLSVVIGPDLAVSLTGLVNSEWFTLIMAYLLPLVVVTMLCLLAGWGMEKTLEALKLGCVNRVLGAALAGAVAAAVLALLLMTAVRLSPELAAMEERSALLARVRAVMAMGRALDPAETAPQEVEEPAATGDTDPANEGSSGR
jgi:uncharacterized membrane protein required for colicin V production